MHPLIFAATALSIALCPAFSVRAEPSTPVLATPVTLASPADLAATAPEAPLTMLTVKDGDGTLRTLLCRPISEEKAAPLPRRAAPETATRALPASPAQAPAAPASRQASAPPQPCRPPLRPTDLNITPGAPLYADPAAVAAAWNCYVPRQMAYAPRAWRAPDPAVHSPLPPLRSVSRVRTRAGAPAKAPIQVGIDVLVSTVQALCPPLAATTGGSAGTAVLVPAAMPAPLVEAATAASPTDAAAAASRNVYGGPAPAVP